MSPFAGELIGTTILLLLGNGVVANVVLAQTKGNDSGWLVIAAGWGFAVFSAVLCVSDASGAHLNPAVTIGLALAGEFSWMSVPSYLGAQMLGAFIGACLVYVVHLPHYQVTNDANLKLATFCTSPAIHRWSTNMICEALATFVLVYTVLMGQSPSFSFPSATPEPVEVGLGSVGAIPVGLVVLAIGLCLGGPTGYAINPARDLAPRIAHAILPISNKRDSNWSYAAVPVLGPLLGALLAAGLYLAFDVALPVE